MASFPELPGGSQHQKSKTSLALNEASYDRVLASKAPAGPH